MNVKRNQSLFKLIREGDVSNVCEFLEDQYVDFSWKREIQQKSGDSVLHVATRNGNIELLKWLIVDKHLDTDISNYDGKQSIHDAAQFGHLNCLQFLIEQGAQVDCLKRADWTPLMLACTKGSVDIVIRIINAGANIHLINKDGWNCFHLACREGNGDIVNYLLDCDASIWNAASKNGRTALHTAALHDRHDVVLILLRRAEYTSKCVDSCGTTPLMDALRAGSTRIASILIEHKADVHKEDTMGRTALHLAAQSGCERSVTWLVCQQGVSVDSRSSVTGITPLHLAAKEGQHDMISLLCKLGADVNITDNRSRTALHQACGGQFTECVHALCKNGAIAVPDDAGVMPHTLAQKQDILDILTESS